MISDRRPDPDATVVRYGLRWLLWTLPLVVLLGGVGVLGLLVLIDQGFHVVALVCLLGLVWSGFALRTVLRWRGLVTALDANGFWVLRHGKAVLIPWDSLAGVGLHWTRVGRRLVHTVELCPRGDIDRDDPLLREFVRDTAPLREGLPRLRYRLDVRHFFSVYDRALRRWAPPELWFGRVEQPGSYLRQPAAAGLTRQEP
ncbi:hypothetical protein [Streptomyces sp. NPDC101165]|uniref:hypothetical protein n=1 Tax=Streptomyces sp. NPDC101165 TaxID=3366119 RepID=UPI00380CA513